MKKDKIKEEVNKTVDEFAEEMKRVLLSPKNIIKGNSWKTMDIDSLKHHLRSEYAEWRDSEEMNEEESDRRELIDIANICMMLWHRTKEGIEK
jgi:hypothetical protein